jgi:uncharacterized membrane-anchored protein
VKGFSNVYQALQKMDSLFQKQNRSIHSLEKKLKKNRDIFASQDQDVRTISIDLVDQDLAEQYLTRTREVVNPHLTTNEYAYS